MAVITKQQLENAALDAVALENIVNGAADRANPGHPDGTVTTRLGVTIRTIANVLSLQIAQETIATQQAEIAATKAAEAANSATIAAAVPNALIDGPRLLENTANIYGFISTRRLVSTYSGPLVRLRKSTDTTGAAEQDFYAATGSDKLDVAAITTWLGADSAFVRKVYGQRNTSHYAEQATTTRQPSLTISGADAFVTFASGKYLNLSSMLDFAVYKDGVTIGLIGQVPGVPDTARVLVGFSKGTGANNNRAGLIIDTSNRLRLSTTPFDDLSGYHGTGSEVSVGTSWFAAVTRADWRGGTGKVKVGSTETSYTMSERVKSEKTTSAGARLNGHSTDSGLAWNFHTLVLYDAIPSDVVTEQVRGALATYVPGYVAPTPASTIWLVGDSQVAGNSIVPNSTYQPTATYADRPGPVLANKYESATGTYRYVHKKGYPGQTSGQIRTNFIDTIVSQLKPNDVVYIQAGTNNDYSTPTLRQAIVDDIQAMIDAGLAAQPTVKFIVGTVPFFSSETSTPLTTKWTNKNALNTQLSSAFASYIWDVATMLATYGGNTDGRTPDALLWRFENGHYDGHRGVLGTKVEYADGSGELPGLFGVIQARAI